MWPLMFLIVIPVIEIMLFIQVGGLIGVWPTIGLVLLAAIVGVTLVRRHGTRTLGAVQAALQRGEDPGERILGAALILLAAGLFITPGFFSDFIALLLLIPGVRGLLYRLIRARMHLRTATVVMGMGQGAPDTPGERVIDGEFEDVTPVKRPTHEPSGWTRH